MRASIIIALLLFLFVNTLLVFAQQRGAKVEESKDKQFQIKSLIIGISEYKSKEITQLQYAHVDALEFQRFVTKLPNSSNTDITCLINQEATTGNVVMSLYSLSKTASANDKIILYFAGHGDVETLTSKQSGFLLTYDTNPTVYIGSALSIEVVNQFIADMSAKGAQVILISDACRSGKLAGGEDGIKYASSVIANQLKNEIRILACQAHELSREGSQWGGGRGLFSYHLVNGWSGQADRSGNNDGIISLFELEMYLKDNVRKQAMPYKQTPIVHGNSDDILGEVLKEFSLQEIDNNKLLLASNSRSAVGRHDSAVIADLSKRVSTNVLIGKNSALEFYEEHKTGITDPETRGHMDRIICSALITKANEFINKYINSKTLEATTKEIEDNIEYLKHAQRVLDEFDWYKKHLGSKIKFYQSLLEKHKKDFTKSKILLTESIALEPEAPYAYNELGVIERIMNNMLEANKAFSTAMSLSPKWTYAKINLSDLYLEMKRYEDAKKLYGEINADGFNDPALIENLAICYAELGKADSAQYFFNQVVNKSPNSLTILNYAKFLQENRQYSQAVTYLLKNLNDKNIAPEVKDESIFVYSKCLYFQNKYAEYISIINQLPTEKKKKFPEYYKYLALSYLHLKDYQNFQEALTVYASLVVDKEILLTAGEILLSKNEYELSLHFLQQYQDLLPNEDCAYMIGLCYFNLENYEETINWFTTKYPTVRGTSVILGKSYLMINDYQLSKKYFQLSAHQDASNWEGFFWLSVLALMENEISLSLVYLEDAVKRGLEKKYVLEQPVFQNLNKEAKYQSLLRQMKQ